MFINVDVWYNVFIYLFIDNFNIITFIVPIKQNEQINKKKKNNLTIITELKNKFLIILHRWYTIYYVMMDGMEVLIFGLNVYYSHINIIQSNNS